MAKQPPKRETEPKKGTPTKPETVNLSPKELTPEELEAISGGTLSHTVAPFVSTDAEIKKQ